MWPKRKKINTRRQQVRSSFAAERYDHFSQIANSPYPLTVLIVVLFSAGCIGLLGLDLRPILVENQVKTFKSLSEIISLGIIVLLINLATAVHIYHVMPSLIRRPSKLFRLLVLFLVLLCITRLSSIFPPWGYLAIGTTVACAMILSIVYIPQFSLDMTFFYALLACFAMDQKTSLQWFMTMMAAVTVCCYSLKEVRTRMKLVKVAVLASAAAFITSLAMGLVLKMPFMSELQISGYAAGFTLFVGLVLQAILPMIERLFGVATSMTLMDYSDANQPLLRKLAMEAPGTFSHSLLIGSMAETAAEAIDANGLLCRVGAYYHDIGKINKPDYFVENQMGSASRHIQLSPAMSQLVIVGHVKDGIEIAKEFGLPSILRQFIETHHGTTLMEFFYNEARKRQTEDSSAVSESDFRYPGPKPKSREAAIVMLADACESATRSMTELTPPRIESLVHTIAMKRLQDGQFDDCDLTLREMSKIESVLAKSLAGHHHGRIAYPKLAPPQSNGETKSSSNGQ